VHDELVVRCREEDAERCAEVVQEAMCGPGIQEMVAVPLKIDLNIVDKWAEAK
jgi:DNA polymerase I-like protein with 3'-5' exonuclease and polymerase domains